MRRGHEISVESAQTNLDDIAGVRVICSYIDDTRMIADLLTSQDDITLLRKSDYISNPKPNGYRSLHLVVTVPVFLLKSTERVKVEVQIRTIAMDFWACLSMIWHINSKEKAGKLIDELKEALMLSIKLEAEAEVVQYSYHITGGKGWQRRNRVRRIGNDIPPDFAREMRSLSAFENHYKDREYEEPRRYHPRKYMAQPAEVRAPRC